MSWTIKLYKVHAPGRGGFTAGVEVSEGKIIYAAIPLQRSVGRVYYALEKFWLSRGYTITEVRQGDSGVLHSDGNKANKR